MTKPVYPGAKCRVIGAALGPKSPAIGKIVRAVETHHLQHVVWGTMWICVTTDGSTIATIHGDALKNPVFAEDWLEVIEDDDETKTTEETKELEVE